MVIVHLRGGLGNQMFQYAAGLSLARLRRAELSLDLSEFPRLKDREFMLDRLNIKARLATEKEIQGRTKKNLPRPLYLLYWKLSNLRPPHKRSVYRQPALTYDPNFFSARPPILLHGYWQSEKYFLPVREELLEQFQVKAELRGANKETADRIRNTESISLHIRRGDYAHDPKTNRLHGLCSPDYYAGALELAAAGMDSPHCFVFSDDPEFVRAEFRPGLPFSVVDNNGPDRPEEDLRLMSMCRAHVLANSSFSWWGAWLCPHADKTVVAPKRWFAELDRDTRDLIPKEWIRL